MRSFLIALFILTSAGLIFSGYLSAAKLVTGTCAFNEPCPYFLGYPACWYGFAMYLFMFVATLLGLMRKLPVATVLKADGAVSLFGMVFAGSFVVQEIFQSRLTGTLGFSTCVYGLIFYAGIFTISIIGLRRPEHRSFFETPAIKKTIGAALLLIGLFALVTPLTPGSWLIFVGLELLGIRLLMIDKIRSRFKK